MSDIYLSITETPTVVTLTNPLISSNVAQSVTVTNVVSVNVVTMPAITVQAAAPSVTTVAGTVAVSNFPASSSVTISNFPSTQTIAGTVTANLFEQQYNSNIPVFVAAYVDSPGGSVIPVSQDANAGMPISGTVTANIGNPTDLVGGGYASLVDLFANDTIAVRELPAISGTVTANNPSGALTTRFGSVTTANTAQITSAVTNTSRKYLLAQNISSGTVTIGIGFSPTTTQGIQLTAGGGLTFDAFCPTGAVYWLGAVTGAAFTILEG